MAIRPYKLFIHTVNQQRQLINGLQSLRKRYLLKPIEGEKILFNLSPVFREYVKNYCQN